MSECDQFDRCQSHFESIHRKLDRLDEAIRGNGALGINVRLDRLEQDSRRQAKLVWLVLGAAAVALASLVASWLTS